MIRCRLNPKKRPTDGLTPLSQTFEKLVRINASIVANLDRGRFNETDSADLTTSACRVVQKRPQTSGEKLDDASLTWCLRKLAIPVRDHLQRLVALKVA